MDAPLPSRTDVFIAGAGTAGAALAAHLAERGLSVVCVDRAPLDGAGARWVNAVPAWNFDDAGIAQPARPELRASAGEFHMCAGASRIVLRDHGVLELDMRLLLSRLQRRATDAGAVLAGDVELGAALGRSVQTSRGSVRAETIVDASGLTGARLLDQPATVRRDLCAAAQAVHRVADPAGARAFLDAHGIEDGDVFSRLGVAGGYSLLNVSVHGDEVSILTGSIPGDGHASGRAVLEEFVGAQPWIGERLFGGKRAIPLGRAHEVLGKGNVAAIGDAGRQVFSAHGSGIGAGMIAARMLASAIADGGGPEAYAVEWQRTYGGLFAAYDLFRRFSQELEPGELETMMSAGLVDAELATAGLLQRLPKPTPSSLLPRARALASERRALRRVGRLGARIAAVFALYAAYPKRGARTRWSRAVARACADEVWRRA